MAFWSNTKMCTCTATRRCRSWSAVWRRTSGSTTRSGCTSPWTTRPPQWCIGASAEGGGMVFSPRPPSALVKGGRGEKPMPGGAVERRRTPPRSWLRKAVFWSRQWGPLYAAPCRPTRDSRCADGQLPRLLRHQRSGSRFARQVATACCCGFRNADWRTLSVFRCRLSATDVVKLRSRLYDLIDLQKDQVQIIALCAKCVRGIEVLGRPSKAAEAKDVVVVV